MFQNIKTVNTNTFRQLFYSLGFSFVNCRLLNKKEDLIKKENVQNIILHSMNYHAVK